MLNILIAAIAYAVNVAVAFMSDGMWKTAGHTVTQFWLQLAESRRTV